MNDLFNMMKAAASAVVGAQGQARWGIVSNVDAARGAVRVMMQPEGVLSGWLPISQQSAGAGMTMLTVPTVGSQAFVIPDAGDAEHGVVVGFAHNDGAQIPKAPATNGTGGTPSTALVPLTQGETLIYGTDGTVIRYGGAAGMYFKPGGGTLMVDGNVACNGDVFDRHGSLDRLRVHYNAHRHADPQGGTTAVNDNLDPE